MCPGRFSGWEACFRRGREMVVRIFHNSIRAKLFLSHLFVVILVSGSIGTYFYACSARSLMYGLKERLRSSTAMIGRAIDAGELEGIHSAGDVSRPEYIANLEKLRTFQRMNGDIAYVYIMRRVNNRAVFVIDSDESSRQALPGKEYEESVPSLDAGFTGLSVDDKLYTDEWGSFLSGYAPIRNGMGEYLVGMDMRADDVAAKFRELRIAGAISLTASLLLALLFSRYLSRWFMTPIRVLIDRCGAIAEGRLDEHVVVETTDEMERLVSAFNAMSLTLATSERNQRRAFEDLQRARDELGIRVEQRTQDLKEMNERLSREIADRIRAEKALEIVAMTDPLTGLHNRRAISEHLRHEAIRSERENVPFVILLADLDFFKEINDSRGHDVGDQVLVEMAVRLRSSVRAQDIVSRWGGEEFMILLPGTDLDGGLVLAEKIRRNVSDEPYYVGGKEIRLTASIGVSAFSPEITLDGCIRAADQALYRAKENGKDRVEQG